MLCIGMDQMGVSGTKVSVAGFQTCLAFSVVTDGWIYAYHCTCSSDYEGTKPKLKEFVDYIVKGEGVANGSKIPRKSNIYGVRNGRNTNSAYIIKCLKYLGKELRHDNCSVAVGRSVDCATVAFYKAGFSCDAFYAEWINQGESFNKVDKTDKPTAKNLPHGLTVAEKVHKLATVPSPFAKERISTPDDVRIRTDVEHLAFKTVHWFS